MHACSRHTLGFYVQNVDALMEIPRYSNRRDGASRMNGYVRMCIYV